MFSQSKYTSFFDLIILDDTFLELLGYYYSSSSRTISLRTTVR
jgi:hypothetical protein